MPRVRASSLLLLACLAAGTAFAQDRPASLRWEVFDESGKLLRVGTPPDEDPREKVYGVTRNNLVVLDANGIQEAVVSFEALYNNDPFISFTFSVVDFGAPSVFTFSFGNPLLPSVPNPAEVKSSLNVTLSDTTGDGASAAVSGQPAMMVATLSPGAVNMGVNLDSALTIPGAGATPVGSGPLYAPGPTAAFYQPGPGGGPWTFMDASVRFKLSGGADAFSGNGFVEIRPVPEPSTYALILAGFVAMGLVAYRRRAQSRSGGLETKKEIDR